MRRGALLALAALLVPLAGARAASGPEVDISRAPGLQAEVSVAVDPSSPDVLLAGSNRSPGAGSRVYGSTDGGATWSSDDGPPASPGTCVAGDPAVGIDLQGRQFYAFLAASPCGRRGRVALFVSTRPGPGAPWSTPADPVSASGIFDDKPALAVDVSPTSPHRGRVYAAWSRVAPGTGSVLVSSSDDGGASWSDPVAVNDIGTPVTFPSLAVARSGALYVAWLDLEAANVTIDRSTNGGASFGADRVAADYHVGSQRCRTSGLSIPAQPRRCVTPSPVVSVDRSSGRFRGRVYVTYSDGGANGALDVLVAAFDHRLAPLLGFPLDLRPHRVNPPDGARPSDQFLPVSAVDPSSGRLWACFYDTAGERSRRLARFSCSVSADGGRSWSRPLRVASAASDASRRSFGYGDYEGLAVAGGRAHPLWTDDRGGGLGEEIYASALGAE